MTLYEYMETVRKVLLREIAKAEWGFNEADPDYYVGYRDGLAMAIETLEDVAT